MRGFVAYYWTTLVVIVGVVLSTNLSRSFSGPRYFIGRMAGGGGTSYQGIAERGYSYDRSRPSNVAHFPAYPLVGKWVATATGIRTETALLVVANVCLAAAFVLMGMYAQGRLSEAPSRAVGWTLVAFGIVPTTMFFRMAYSESLFLLVAITAMFGMERRAHPLWLAVVIGLGTATRPVGILLLGPFLLYLWQRRDEGCWRAGLIPFICSAVIWLPLACWGIAAFMIFQHMNFGDSLAFFHTQQNFGQRPLTPYWEQWGRALVLEPIWSVYSPSSPAYWASHEREPGCAVVSLSFANPIFLVASAVLVGLGWRKGWLNGRETLLAGLLLAIPYLTHSYRYLMLSQGRFAVVAFPIYLVLGRLMANAPLPVVIVGCAVSGSLLAIYAALFAAGYQLI